MNGAPPPVQKLGPKRLSIDHLDPRERERMQRAGALVVDRRRVRPRYFDGRFLAGRDLARDQEQFLIRQRELAQLAGAGVLSGLEVKLAGETALAITPGVGLTESGDLVLVPDLNATTPEQEPLRIDLADVPTMQRLGFEFGLLDTPSRPTRRPTGLFVLALRAVEYTANPLGGYPASLTAQRTAEDGDVIEATAVTLIPFPDDFAEDDPAQRRALVARAIFLGRGRVGTPADALPIALVQLDSGIVRWVDPFLVRREIGPDHGGVTGFGLAARALREAFLLQYQHHLADVLRARAGTGQSLRFAAAEAFHLLPPAGPLPAAAVDLTRGAQIWFPADVATAIVPTPPDEIAALVEESLLLPPIDPAAAVGVSALILVPTPRRQILVRPTLPPFPIRPPRPIGIGSIDPVSLTSSLGAIVRRGFPAATPTTVAKRDIGPGDPAPAATLWYVRCRTLHAAPDAEIVPPGGG